MAAGGAASVPFGSGLGTATESVGRVIDVRATEPYAGVVSDLADLVDVGRDATVGVDSVDVASADLLSDGSADLVVSGRPDLPGAGGEADADLAVEAAVTPVGRATLRPSEDWYDVLDGRRLRERLSSGGPVVSFSESDGQVSLGAESAAAASPSGRGSDDDSPGEGLHSADATRLVRGSRSFQYARGLGGVGYYEVDAADVGPVADGGDGDGSTPLVALGYAHVRSSASSNEAVRSFVAAFEDDRFIESDGVRYRADPAVADDPARSA